MNKPFIGQIRARDRDLTKYPYNSLWYLEQWNGKEWVGIRKADEHGKTKRDELGQDYKGLK